MTHPSAAQRPSAERWKLASIPILIIVLYFAATSSDGDGGDHPVDAENSAAAESSPPQPAKDEVPTLARSGRQRSLPELPMHRVLAHDPFAIPSAFAEVLNPPKIAPAVETADTPAESAESKSPSPAKPDSSEARLAALAQRRVSMLIRDSRGAAAVIGNKVVRVGELLEEGIRVASISQDGIVLEIVDNTRTHE